MEDEANVVKTAITNRFKQSLQKRSQKWGMYLQELPFEEPIFALRPYMTKVQRYTKHDLPQYLWRVYSDDSAGINKEDGFGSMAIKCDCGPDNFYNFTDEDFADKINQHYRWGHRNIKIAVLDTYEIEDHTLIFSSYPFAKAHGVSSQEILRCLDHEFIVWDSLLADICVVDFKEMAEHKFSDRIYRRGFFELLPQFSYADLKSAEKSRPPLANMVLRHREGPRGYRPLRDVFATKEHEHNSLNPAPKGVMHHKSAGPFSLDPAVMYEFIMLVSGFKPRYKLPVLTALLCSRLQYYELDSDEKQLVRVFRNTPSHFDYHGLKRYSFKHNGWITPIMPELEIHSDMMEAVCLRLGVEVYKGRYRPDRPFINPRKQDYDPQAFPEDGQIYRLGAGINVPMEQSTKVWRQMWTSRSDPRDMQGHALGHQVTEPATPGPVTGPQLYGPMVREPDVDDFLVDADDEEGEVARDTALDDYLFRIGRVETVAPRTTHGQEQTPWTLATDMNARKRSWEQKDDASSKEKVRDQNKMVEEEEKGSQQLATPPSTPSPSREEQRRSPEHEIQPSQGDDQHVRATSFNMTAKRKREEQPFVRPKPYNPWDRRTYGLQGGSLDNGEVARSGSGEDGDEQAFLDEGLLRRKFFDLMARTPDPLVPMDYEINFEWF